MLSRSNDLIRDQKQVFLLGPTASGKTAVAKKLYDYFPLEIISVDSSQIYKELDVGSAKLSQEELKKYPHHLINIKNPSERYSVNEFKLDVDKASKKIYQAGRVPLFVGGTMMYFNSLEHPLNEMPASTDEVRKEVQHDLDKFGLTYLYNELTKLDPVIVKKIGPTDTQRILRAIEVYRISGKPLSYYHQAKIHPEDNYELLKIALLPKDKNNLHKRIEARTNEMIKNGLIDEVRLLLKNNPSLDLSFPSLRSVGYKQVYEFIQGKISLADLNEKITIATRQLAKRQMTWIRSMKNLVLIDPFEEELDQLIKNCVKNFLN